MSAPAQPATMEEFIDSRHGHALRVYVRAGAHAFRLQETKRIAQRLKAALDAEMNKGSKADE